MKETHNLILNRKLTDLCKVANVFGYCRDVSGNVITSYEGSEAEAERLNALIDMQQCADACHRIHTSEYEDLLMEETSVPWIRIGVVDVKMDGISGNVIWCFVAVLSDLYPGENMAETGFRTVTDSAHFSSFMDCMVDFATPAAKEGGQDAASASGELPSMGGAFPEVKMGLTVKRLGATTELVQLLDQEEAIERSWPPVWRSFRAFWGSPEPASTVTEKAARMWKCWPSGTV